MAEKRISLVELEARQRRAFEDYHDALEFRRSLQPPREPLTDRTMLAYERCLDEAGGDRNRAWAAYLQWEREDPESRRELDQAIQAKLKQLEKKRV